MTYYHLEHSHFHYVLLGFAVGVGLCAAIAGWIWMFVYRQGFSEKFDTPQASLHVEKQLVVDEAERIVKG